MGTSPPLILVISGWLEQTLCSEYVYRNCAFRKVNNPQGCPQLSALLHDRSVQTTGGSRQSIPRAVIPRVTGPTAETSELQGPYQYSSTQWQPSLIQAQINQSTAHPRQPDPDLPLSQRSTRSNRSAPSVGTRLTDERTAVVATTVAWSPLQHGLDPDPREEASQGHSPARRDPGLQLDLTTQSDDLSTIALTAVGQVEPTTPTESSAGEAPPPGSPTPDPLATSPGTSYVYKGRRRDIRKEKRRCDKIAARAARTLLTTSQHLEGASAGPGPAPLSCQPVQDIRAAFPTVAQGGVEYAPPPPGSR